MRALETLSSETELEIAGLEEERLALLERLKNADQRFFAAKEILATPIDDLRTDLMLTEEAEQRLSYIMERMNRKIPNSPDSSEVIRLEQENSRRRSEITRLRTQLEVSRSRSLAFSNRFETQRPRQPKFSITQTSPRLVQSQIEQIFTRLDERRSAIEDENSAIDAVEASNEKLRQRCEADFDGKVQKIKALGEKLRRLEATNVQLGEARNIVREFSNEYEELRLEKEKVLRWQQTIEAVKQRMAEKTAQMKSRDEQIAKKRAHVEALSGEVNDLEAKIREMEIEVQNE